MSAEGVCPGGVCAGGMSAHGGARGCVPGGVCVPGGCVPRVSAQEGLGGCVPRVSAQEGVCVPGDVSVQGGVTDTPWTDRHL